MKVIFIVFIDFGHPKPSVKIVWDFFSVSRLSIYLIYETKKNKNMSNLLIKRCAARVAAILVAAIVSLAVWKIMGHYWPETTKVVLEAAQAAGKIGWTTGLATIMAPLLGSLTALFTWFLLDPGEYDY